LATAGRVGRPLRAWREGLPSQRSSELGSDLKYTRCTGSRGDPILSAAAFVRAQLKRLHTGLEKSLADLTPEQLHAVPAGHQRANTIAWRLWHYARTEDNVVRWVIQERRPPIWTEAGYGERLGLPPVAQGTGMSTQEAHALRIKDLPLFQEYMQKVWAGTEEGTTQGHLALPLPVEVGERPLSAAVGRAHRHFGGREGIGRGERDQRAVARGRVAGHDPLAREDPPGAGPHAIEAERALIFRRDDDRLAVRAPPWASGER
jgi:hypothetical protein